MKDMQDFLKHNWFKFGLLVVAIIVALSYLFVRLPSEKRKESLANDIKCQQEGTQLFERMRKELSSNQTYGEPEFRFVSKLNTCLYNGFLLSERPYGFSLQRFIKDVYTNKELAGFIHFDSNDGKDINSGEEEEYGRLQAEYFSSE